MENDIILPEEEDPLGCPEENLSAAPFLQQTAFSDTHLDTKGNDAPKTSRKNGESKSLFANPKTHSFRRKYYPGIRMSQWNDWQWQLRNRITGLKGLERIITPSEEERNALNTPLRALPMSITPYYASLIDGENPLHAIRRTVVPVEKELLHSAGEEVDPLGEENHSPVPGLIHRYPDRVLFLVVNACATYCRYCTRSRMVGSQTDCRFNPMQWEAAIEYISRNSQIRDVIVSGGDPLMLSDGQVGWILQQLKRIPHLEMIRIGTKAPVVLPQRITPALTRMLKRFQPLYMSIHFTHPDELTPETMLACNRLADAGIPLGSQTVLLKGINDKPETLTRLFQGLLKVRVKPYYLYQCDPIPGSAHFRTAIETGTEMIRSLRGFTSGYAIPSYVIDLPGGGGKIPLLPDYVARREKDAVVINNYRNKEFRYPLPEETAPVDTPKPPPKRLRTDAPLLVGLTYDLRKEYLEMGYGEEETAEFDKPETIEAIENALQEIGFATDRIGNIRTLTRRIAEGNRWDMVFNIAEGLKGFGREAQVPALLEANGIPYTFSDPLVLSLTLHKGLTKRVVRDLGVPTPDFMVVEKELNGEDISLPFPLFAKPVAEGTGKGIDRFSKIDGKEQLREVCHRLLAEFRQPVLVERFLPGREFTVGIVGSGDRARSIGVIEVLLNDDAEPDAYSYENKQRFEKLVSYRLVDDHLAQQAANVALQAWKGLGCLDAGRIDIRVDENGMANFIEVNPLAGLHPHHSDLCIIGNKVGLSYTGLIGAIMASAMERYNLHIPAREMQHQQGRFAHA